MDEQLTWIIGATPINIEIVLSVSSAIMTAYFWLVKANRELPDLKFYQLLDFRPSLRRGDPERGTKRLGLAQIESGGVLVANNSTRQNSIVRFDCFLKHEAQWMKGTWGYVENDKPPWNIPPESTIALSPACFFDVPESYETPEDLTFRVEFITASGKRFHHVFSRSAPEL